MTSANLQAYLQDNEAFAKQDQQCKERMALVQRICVQRDIPRALSAGVQRPPRTHLGVQPQAAAPHSSTVRCAILSGQERLHAPEAVDAVT